MLRSTYIRSLKETRYLVSSFRSKQTVCSQLQLGKQHFYSTTSDTDFIHESIIPSDHFQKGLFRLPIPKLEETCGRYYDSQYVLLQHYQRDNLRILIEAFKNDDGEELHQELQMQDLENKHTSYISEPWFDMYLRDRRPVSLTHNPFISFTDDPNPAYMDQLIRATNMVVSSLRFMKTLRANVLEPDLFHLNKAKSDTDKFRRMAARLPSRLAVMYAMYNNAFPLDMSQYGNLFNATRIPRFQKDELFVDPSAKHMLVMRNGYMYLFDAIDKDGYSVAPEVIMAHLKYIMEDPRPPNKNSIGVLTTMNRDRWTLVRTQLCNAGVMNEGYMKLVDSALFALVLDDCAPENPNEISRNFLHSDGTNRWFDKSFSLILTKDGRAAVNFEHAWGDGVAVLRYFNEVFEETTKKPSVHPDTAPANVDSDKIVQKIEFAMDPKLKEYIQDAKTEFQEKTSSLDVDHLEYTRYTKKYFKEKGMGPDAMMQLAIQLAYYRLHGKTVPTYESCSTAAFKKGRTETVRSATLATQQACEMIMFTEKPVPVEQIQTALSDCTKIHNALTKNAAMGKGWDRHLFALKYLADSKGQKVELFEDDTYKHINHIILSTSTLTSPAVVIGGFGAVTEHGYGVGYAVENDRIGFNVTNYPPKTNVHQFVECLKLSLDDIYEVLEGRHPRKS